LGLGGIDSFCRHYLAPSVRAADRANVVRLAGIMALWALDQLERLEVLLAAAVATAFA